MPVIDFSSVMNIHRTTAFIKHGNRFNNAHCGRAPGSASHEYSCGGIAALRGNKKYTAATAVLWLIFVAFFAVVFCAVADAQPSPARRAFAGRVTTDNGLPVGGAAVTLRRQITGSAAFWGTVLYSDARGDFSFPDAEDGDYSVTVEAGGLARMSSAFNLSEKSPFLKATLDRLATVSIRVLRLDGTPLANTVVSLVAAESTRGENSMRRGTTDSQGVFSFNDATPGVVSLRIVAPRVGWVDLNDLQIAPGSRAASIDARLQAGAMLRLTARDAAPAASDAAKAVAQRVLGGVTVTLSMAATDASRFKGMVLYGLYANTNGNLLTRDGESATELSALAPGTYSVSLGRNNYGTAVAQIVEIKATETASLEFEMKRADGISVGSVALVAQGAKGQALSNRDVLVSMQMLAPNSDDAISYAHRNARTDANGRVVLYPLEVGRWRLTPNIAAKVDTPGEQNSPAAAAQIATVAAISATESAALTFSFATE